MARWHIHARRLFSRPRISIILTPLTLLTLFCILTKPISLSTIILPILTLIHFSFERWMRMKESVISGMGGIHDGSESTLDGRFRFNSAF